MLRRLSALIYPKSSDEVTARREFLLNTTTLLLGLGGAMMTLLGIVLIVQGIAVGGIVLIVGGGTVFMSVVIWNLGQHGHPRAATFLLSLTVWAAVTGLLAGGLWFAPLLLGYALSVALAVLLGSPVNGLLFTVLGVLAYGLIGRQWIAGRLPTIGSPEQSLDVSLIVLGVELLALGLFFYVFDRQWGHLSARRLEEARRCTQELKQVTRERDELAARLQKVTQDQEQLEQTIRTISAPVLPLFEGLIVMPIVGRLDRVRAQLLFGDIMDGIARYRASSVLLDLTGLSTLDAESAAELLKAVQGAQMLGSRCYLVGVQPDVAAELVQLDVDLSVLGCYGTLREGLADLMARGNPYSEGDMKSGGRKR